MKYKHGIACRKPGCGCETFHIVKVDGIVNAICSACGTPYNDAGTAWTYDEEE